MSSADVQGQFLWHELTTADPSAAGAFYSRVFGWKTRAWDKDPSYTIWESARGPAGGMTKLPADAQAGGISHGWLAYVGVADVEAVVASAQRLGGRVVKGVAALPDGGKYAVLSDPQSGVFGVHAPPSAGMGGPAAEFTWHELATADHAAAFRFYHELFGWEQLGVHDMGAMGSYLLFGRNGRQLGGMFNRPSSMAASWPHWLVYVRVASAAKAAEAAAAAGGRVVNGPHEVPGGSWIAQLVDPQGIAIAVNQPPQQSAANAEAAHGAAPHRPARPAHAAVSHAPAARPAAAVKPAATARPQAAARAPLPVSERPSRSAAGKPAARKAAARKATPRRAPAAKKRAAAKKAPAAKRAKRAAAPRRKSSAKSSARRRPAARGSTSRSRTKAAAKRPVSKSARSKSARKRSVRRGRR